MNSPGRSAQTETTFQPILELPVGLMDALDGITRAISDGSFHDGFNMIDESGHSSDVHSQEEREATEKHVADQLAHEVILNPSIKLTQDETQNELFRKVKETMKRAFWDGIKYELVNPPPIYDRIIRMLEEIREGFLSLTPKKSVHLLEKLGQQLNPQELGQLLASGAFTNEIFMGLVQFCIDYIQELEAPIRSERTRRWMVAFDASVSRTAETEEGRQMLVIQHLPEAFEYVFDKIEEIRLDVMNTQLQMASQYLLHHGVEYERSKFAAFIQSQSRETQQTLWEDVSRWLQRGDWLLRQHGWEISFSANPDSALDKIWTASFVASAWNYDTRTNVTMRLDMRRVQQMQNQVQLCTLMAAHLQAVGAHLQQSRCVPLPEEWDELRKTLYGALTSPSVSLHRLHAALKSALARLRARHLQRLSPRTNESTTSTDPAPSDASVAPPELVAASEADDAFLRQMLGQTCSLDDPLYRLLTRRLCKLVLEMLLSTDADPLATARSFGLAAVLPHIHDLAQLVRSFAPHSILVHRPWVAVIAGRIFNSV
eukprot:TRINITY_DN49_c0_g4_i3.p1 TRINITY_DN49_c0_g4~~TRINITY_DN49_c0_g4_i3.p1  ORF type:complete len:543 (-),score=112.49 TRINITY_DN49_c0_g4_i3:1142-2770(-)